MSQRDWMLRMIEQAGLVLSELRSRLVAGEVDEDEAERELNEVAGQAGLDLRILRFATPDTLVMLVAPTGEPDPGRCWLLAETLFVDGLRAELAGDVDGALVGYERSARLFAMLAEKKDLLDTGLAEAAERLREVEARRAALAAS